MNKLTRYSIKQRMLNHFKKMGLLVVFFAVSGNVNSINAQQLKAEAGNVEQLKPTVQYEQLDANKTKVIYNFENKRALNPYTVSFDYLITTNGTGTFIETKSFLDDLDLRLEENVDMQYEGAEVFYPSEMSTTTNLENVEGKFTITIPNVDLKLFYDVEISGRKVVEVRDVNINGQIHVAYLIKSNFRCTKYADAEMISQSNEQILDLYVPDLGNTERQRSGNLASRNGDVTINKAISNIILN